MWTTLASWLLKVDPTVAIMTVSSLGTWLWHKVSSEKRATISNAVDAIIDNFLVQLLGELPDPKSSVPLDQYLKNARAWMEDTFWKVAAKRGVPKNATTINLVHAAVERASAALGKRVLEHRAALAKETP